jgi:hypothetical protein
MALRAPLRVPVELRRDGRWFRLAEAVGPTGLALTSAVPDELDGPLMLAFHLPGDPVALRCHGEAREVRLESQEPRRSEIAFLDLTDEERTRILAYVRERLGLEGIE